MRTHFRQAALVLAAVACGGTAGAQTAIIREPAETEIYVRGPIELAPLQRRIIYRTIVQERVATPIVREQIAPGTAEVEYRVGVRVPATVELHEMPDRVVVDVPMIQRYRYLTISNRVLIVDPATSTIVGEVYEQD